MRCTPVSPASSPLISPSGRGILSELKWGLETHVRNALVSLSIPGSTHALQDGLMSVCIRFLELHSKVPQTG